MQSEDQPRTFLQTIDFWRGSRKVMCVGACVCVFVCVCVCV
jgi:hypothetical protein